VNTDRIIQELRNFTFDMNLIQEANIVSDPCTLEQLLKISKILELKAR
jgi:hypothetical protein